MSSECCMLIKHKVHIDYMVYFAAKNLVLWLQKKIAITFVEQKWWKLLLQCKAAFCWISHTYKCIITVPEVTKHNVIVPKCYTRLVHPSVFTSFTLNIVLQQSPVPNVALLFIPICLQSLFHSDGIITVGAQLFSLLLFICCRRCLKLPHTTALTVCFFL